MDYYFLQTMRKRFNRIAVASSENYSASRRAHYNMLKENHEKYSEFYITINIECRISPEEIMRANLERMYLEYKRNKALEEAKFKARFKNFIIIKHS